MCGITGYISFKQPISHSQKFLTNALKSLHKRGPDNNGVFKDNKCELGHARLSIIDTSEAANQPMQDSSSRFTIVFNGEIYNFKTIKKILQEKGHHFLTNSDTEVVLHALVRHA